MDLLYSAGNIITLLNAFEDEPSSKDSPSRVTRRRRRTPRIMPQLEASTADVVSPEHHEDEELPEPQAPDRPESPSDDEMCGADEMVADEVVHPPFTRDHLMNPSTLVTFEGGIRFRRYGVLSSIYREEYKMTQHREYAFMYPSGLIIIPNVFVYDTYTDNSGYKCNKVCLNIQVLTMDKRIAEINHTYINKFLVSSHVVMVGNGTKVKIILEDGALVRYITKGTATPTRDPFIKQFINYELENKCNMMIVKNGPTCLICELICTMTGKSMVISKPNVSRVRFGDVNLLFNCTGLISV